jgi:multicomponent Na+:H+ antiporter subunit D
VTGTLPNVPVTMLVPIVVLLGGSLALGVVPGFAEAVGKAAHQFIDRDGYVTQALTNAAAAPVPHVPEMHWTTLGIALGLTSAVLSFAIAFAGLYPQRFPTAVRRGAGMFGVPLRVVRRAHSGHIGDYVAWLLVGLALLGALVGVPVR